MKQLRAAIQKLKNNKAPGPDGCSYELIKWLDADNRRQMLIVINARPNNVKVYAPSNISLTHCNWVKMDGQE